MALQPIELSWMCGELSRVTREFLISNNDCWKFFGRRICLYCPSSSLNKNLGGVIFLALFLTSWRF